MNRRDFLRYCMACGLSFPLLTHAKTAETSNPKTLILIELQGGNDGLNTLVPYTDPLYYEYRPTIAMQSNEVIQLNNQLAFHHALESLMPIWENKNLMVMLGVGYENPVLSHFRSIEIWNTASASNEYLQEGWLTQAIPNQSQRPINGLVLGGSFGPLQGVANTLQIRNVEQFLQRSANTSSQEHLKTHQQNNAALNKLLNTQAVIDEASSLIKTQLKPLQAPINFDNNPFAQQMALATQVVQSNLNIPAIKVRHGSFDTHANQKPNHARLLKQLADAIYASEQALTASGHWQQTTLMTYSEFGRRAKENGSKGTDHGTAAPHFIIGGAVQGGIQGKQPELAHLEKDNLVYAVDFKQLYKSKI